MLQPHGDFLTLRNHPQLTENRLTNLIQALVNLQKETQTFILLLPFQKSEDLGNCGKDSYSIKRCE